jgi:uncharacterized protein YegJ (DUF2314 family)
MGLWNWLQKLFRNSPTRRHVRSEEKPLNALVLFLTEPRRIDSTTIAEIATDTLGTQFRDDDSGDQENFVTGASPSFVVKHGEAYFLINVFPRPYMDNPEVAANNIPELRLRKVIKEHTAWLSVDLLGEFRERDLPHHYRIIGKLIAALADDDCLAIFAPATGQIAVFDSETCEKLQGKNPLDVFSSSGHPPVVPVSGDDPRLKAAVSRARRTWSQFESAFEERRADQNFAVKARIGNDDDFEFMWLTVTGIENGIIYGKLDNDPVELTSVRCGDRVRVPVRELNDWLYTDGEHMQGGFTIEVLRKIQDEMQNESF